MSLADSSNSIKQKINFQQTNMLNIIDDIKDTKELISVINQIKAKNQQSNFATFFRGTHKKLVPSLGEIEGGINELEKIEKKALEIFHKKAGLKNWDSLSIKTKIIAREHNLKSSLMDWSNEIYTPLDFGTKAYKLKDYVNYLYILSLPLNEIKNLNNSQEHLNIEKPTMINYHTPQLNSLDASKRKFIQGGYFLYQPYKLIRKELIMNLDINWILHKITLDKNLAKPIRKEILNKQFDLRYSLMPNYNQLPKKYNRLDALAKRLNKKISNKNLI